MNIHYWGFDAHPYMRDKTLKREVRIDSEIILRD